MDKLVLAIKGSDNNGIGYEILYVSCDRHGNLLTSRPYRSLFVWLGLRVVTSHTSLTIHITQIVGQSECCIYIVHKRVPCSSAT